MNVPNLQIVWLAPQGSAVRKGDPVVRFDASGAERQLKEQLASLAQAQATLDQAIADGKMTTEQDKLDLATQKQAAETQGRPRIVVNQPRTVGLELSGKF